MDRGRFDALARIDALDESIVLLERGSDAEHRLPRVVIGERHVIDHRCVQACAQTLTRVIGLAAGIAARFDRGRRRATGNCADHEKGCEPHARKNSKCRTRCKGVKRPQRRLQNVVRWLAR